MCEAFGEQPENKFLVAEHIVARLILHSSGKNILSRLERKRCRITILIRRIELDKVFPKATAILPSHELDSYAGRRRGLSLTTAAFPGSRRGRKAPPGIFSAGENWTVFLPLPSCLEMGKAERGTSNLVKIVTDLPFFPCTHTRLLLLLRLSSFLPLPGNFPKLLSNCPFRERLPFPPAPVRLWNIILDVL